MAVERASLELAERGELLAMAERAVEQAVRAGADEAEAFVQESRTLGVDIERTMVEGATSGGDFGVGVRVVKGGRPGFGYAAEARLVPRAIDAALHAARQSPREPLRFPEAKPAPSVASLDARVLELGPEALAERAQAIIEAAKQVHAALDVTGGGVGASSETWALANSKGLRHEERSVGVGASCACVLKDGALSTGSHHQSSRRDALDLVAIGSKAARLAVDSRRPKAVASGAYDLLLKPDALQELLEFGCLRGLLAENLRRKESPWVGKLGQRVMPRTLSLWDDGMLEGGLATGERDDEGVPSRRTAIVEDGVLRGALHDLRSARRDKAEPTASAVRADRGDDERTYLAPPRAAGRNWVLDGPRKPLAQLIAETQKGLLVHDVIGAHTANTTSGEFHVNSALLFRVERGEVAGPAKSVMLSGAMPAWLKKVSGLSAEASDLSGYASPAALRLPWVRVAGATVHA